MWNRLGHNCYVIPKGKPHKQKWFAGWSKLIIMLALSGSSAKWGKGDWSWELPMREWTTELTLSTLGWYSKPPCWIWHCSICFLQTPLCIHISRHCVLRRREQGPRGYTQVCILDLLLNKLCGLDIVTSECSMESNHSVYEMSHLMPHSEGAGVILPVSRSCLREILHR